MTTQPNNSSLHVVVLVHQGLGDLIMALPTLVSIDRSLALNSTLSIVVKSPLEARLIDLVQWQSRIEPTLLGDSHCRDYSRVARLIRTLRSKRPDVLLALHRSKGLMLSLFARLLSASLSVGPRCRWSFFGFDRTVNCPPNQHKVEYYSHVAESSGLCKEFTTNISLKISRDKRVAIRKSLRVDDGYRSVVIAPGTSPVEAHKLWPKSYYRMLIARLLSSRTDIRIVLLGGPTEYETLESLVSGQEANGRISLVAQPDIEFSLAVLAESSCLVCSCSGPAHLAAIVNTPIVALYGPTNPTITGPYTDIVRIVRKGYRCSPCYRQGFVTGCGNPICITDISVDEVLDAIIDTLDGKQFPHIPMVSTTDATMPQRT